MLSALVLLGACFVGFGALARAFPCNAGRPVFFSKSIGLDLGYALLGLLYAGAAPAAAALLAATPAAALMQGGWIGQAPPWAQLIGLLLATDFVQYWLHRAFHDRRLWPYHAVHHSAPDVNWTTTFRTHPVNYLAMSALLGVAARLAGFSETTLLVAAPIFFFSGAWTHANLNWTFGPLKYVLASPVFHRWHHSVEAGPRERNFAPMFPLWDVLFGTFYMPAGARPERFGAEGVPGDMLGQLIHPWRAAAAAQPGAREPA
jgi:sterol desaturase/sphingolipid hydroxylase (fatty acid hydroxylase superfamily)